VKAVGVLGVVVAALALGGCGGDENEIAQPQPPATDTAAQDTTTADQNAGGSSEQPTTSVAEPAPPLPEAVEEMRLAIATAAAVYDYDGLAELIPAEGFTYTFGGPVEGGPTAYWKQIEATENPLGALAAILEMPYTRADDIYVWPFAYDRDPASLTRVEREILSVVATGEELDQMAEFGHYLGWRAGIREDGTWVFFVAGD
jgi:hypothetical protein